jgi:hypothetical protein
MPLPFLRRHRYFVGSSWVAGVLQLKEVCPVVANHTLAHGGLRPGSMWHKVCVRLAFIPSCRLEASHFPRAHSCLRRDVH